MGIPAISNGEIKDKTTVKEIKEFVEASGVDKRQLIYVVESIADEPNRHFFKRPHEAVEFYDWCNVGEPDGIIDMVQGNHGGERHIVRLYAERVDPMFKGRDLWVRLCNGKGYCDFQLLLAHKHSDHDRWHPAQNDDDDENESGKGGIQRPSLNDLFAFLASRGGTPDAPETDDDSGEGNPF